MKGLNRVKKLLCYAFITVFLLGFGGEIVRAETVTYDKNVNYSFENGINTRVKKMGDKYVFCLDPGLWVSSGNYNPVSGDSSILGLKNIIMYAYIHGLGTGSNDLGVNENDLYVITQLAVWNWYNNTKIGENWLRDNEYAAIYNEFFSYVYDKEYSLNINTDNYGMTLEGNYYISHDFSIDGLPDNLEYTVSINDSSYSDSCLVYNGDCVSEFTTTEQGTNFKVRLPKPSTEFSGQLEASFKVKTSEYDSYDDSSLIKYVADEEGKQSLIYFSPSKKSLTNNVTVSATQNGKKKVSIQKTDVSGNKVEGALLAIKDSNENILFSALSTSEGKENPTFGLSEGTYYLSELKAPANYSLNKNDIEFKVEKQNDILVVKQNNGSEFVEVPAATISIDDIFYSISFRKLDKNGNPLAGIKIEIYDTAALGVFDEDKTVNNYICAITDSDGFLTQPCSEETARYSSSNGQYYLNSKRLYTVRETFGNSHFYVQEFTDEMADFYFAGGIVIPFANNLQIPDSDSGVNEMAILNIINQNFLDISKSDVTGGKEISGAEIYIYDAVDTFKSDDGTEGLITIDHWVSTDEVHKFVGIIPNHMYILEEVSAPEGYDVMVSKIKFSMDEDGVVHIFDYETGEEIENSEFTDPNSAYHMWVINKLKTPSTGVSIVNLVAIGGFMIFAGYEIIRIYRRKALVK